MGKDSGRGDGDGEWRREGKGSDPLDNEARAHSPRGRRSPRRPRLPQGGPGGASAGKQTASSCLALVSTSAGVAQTSRDEPTGAGATATAAEAAAARDRGMYTRPRHRRRLA
ncbi:unnamed protein product, partial [Ectocarpus sp. 12 AP-2014]